MEKSLLAGETSSSSSQMPVVQEEITNPIAADKYDEIIQQSRKSLSSAFEVEHIIDALKAEDDLALNRVPDMWSWNYIGLYSQYAAVGLLYGSNGTLLPICVYYYEGASNVCSNARNIVLFGWSLKIFFAVITDRYRPFGKRRQPWMLFGWACVLILLLVLAFTAHLLDVTEWLIMLLLVQGFLMFSDVPADGYSVELGQLERGLARGQILATGQRVRFFFSVVAGSIQTFFLNGPHTNAPDCPTKFEQCWSWGLTVNQYYGALFVIVLILTVPICFLKELDASKIPQHTLSHFMKEIWETLQNRTTFYVMLFVLGTQGLTNFVSNANIYLQFYVIKLTNFEAGIDTITTYLALVAAIYIFQTYLINKNWRYTQVGSTIASAALGLLWIMPYYDTGGTQSPWFTIFIDLDQGFAQGLTQILYSMAVIELAKPGLEATTYELIISVGNAAVTLNGIISTQLLYPVNALGCTDGNCPSNSVDLTNKQTFDESHGPIRFTNYCFLVTGISVGACLFFVQFLPASKEQCHEWKAIGEAKGNSVSRAYLTLGISVVAVTYGVIIAVLLLDAKTSCEQAVGGTGCDN